MPSQPYGFPTKNDHSLIETVQSRIYSAPKPIPRWMAIALIFSAWSLIGILMTSRLIWIHYFGSDDCPSTLLILSRFPQYILWALITPFILKIPGSHRFMNAPLWKRILCLALIGLAILVCIAAINILNHNLFVHGSVISQKPPSWYANYLLDQNLLPLLIFVGLLSFAFALHAYRQSKARQWREMELQTQLTQAKLQALQTQIQPHFLFNTLNTISALVERDPQATKRVVARLSQLLRNALDSHDEQMVPLSKELGFLEGYLEILEIRFEHRLRFKREVDPEVLHYLVPNLLLQPLVENAIKHGFHRMPKQGLITIGAKEKDNKLQLWVYDNGCGSDLSHLKFGIGLSNLRDRLSTLYGDRCHWYLDRGEDGGLTVDIFLPLMGQQAVVESAPHKEVQSA